MMTATHNSKQRTGMRRGFVTNTTFNYTGVYPVPTTTEPVSSSTRIVLDACGSAIEIFPFGQGTNDQTLSIRLHLWRKMAGTTPLWVPSNGAEFECTMSSELNGVDGSPLGADEMFVDEIVESFSFLNTRIRNIGTPGIDCLTSITLDPGGYDKIQIQVNADAGADGCGEANFCYAIY